MNLRIVGVLLLTELRQIYRDRAAVFMSMVLPLAVMPIVMLSMSSMQTRREALTRTGVFRYALQGPQTPVVRRLLETALPRSGGSSGPTFQELPSRQPVLDLKDDRLDLVLKVVPSAELTPPARPRTRAPQDAVPQAAFRLHRLPGAPELQVLFMADRERCVIAMSRLRELLESALDDLRVESLRQRLPQVEDDAGPVQVQRVDLATPAEKTGAILGPLAAFFLTVFLASGAASVALQSLAGEKERGTLETLLTTSVGRPEIIAAKQAASLIFAFGVALVQVVNLAVYLVFRWVPLPATFTLQMGPLQWLAFAALGLGLAAFLAGVMLVVSACSRTFREASMLFLPVFIILVFLSLIPAVPGLPLASAVSLVPVAGVGVALRDLLAGRPDWPWIAVAFLSTTAGAVGALRLSSSLLENERLISPTMTDEAEILGGPPLFYRRVWIIFATLGAVLLVSAAGLSTPKLVRVQLVFNQVLFLLTTVGAIVAYRLPWREVLAARLPRWPAWIAILALVPAGQIVGNAVSSLALRIFPIPGLYAQEFTRMLDLEGTPAWQLYVALAVLPGICEEVAFRGLLLHGLHRKMRPLALALTVGLVFGLFHFALFRIVPTAVLGVLLTAVALLTGSIFPCMIAHAGNNAMAVWMATRHVDLEGQPGGFYLAGAALALVAFYILYRVRTPYPGLQARDGRLSKSHAP